MTKISHIGIGLYQGQPTAAVVVQAGAGVPKTGDYFRLAGQDWRVAAAVRYRGLDDGQVQAPDPDLVALIVENGDALVEARDSLAGQVLEIIR
ncbi:MAG: hypothetical protein Q4G24_10995 [Paracoccus sp. (in: a-proteobacteria)]|uniref:hypothetical protein n=1 Tax=Paracoccus sp. TaxID=267 RepID=UPI0026DF11D6|nr:hypothetical protein [Paracoccus sp. (in: a-proteobacteria)]MDO5621985.1 hypothetical protein [Paracoccus sp. (in: a-proteobacteria)]